jgi:hypothetical protein
MRLKRSFLLIAGAAVLAVSAAAVPAFASGTSASLPRTAAAGTPTLIPVVPGSNAAPQVTGPPEQFLNLYGDIFDCWNIDGGIVYGVNATNIHIWNYPGGSPDWEINKGAWFDTSWLIQDTSGGPEYGPYHCISYGTDDGNYWVFGFRNFGAPNSTEGFVGMQYLDLVGFIS